MNSQNNYFTHSRYIHNKCVLNIVFIAKNDTNKFYIHFTMFL